MIQLLVAVVAIHFSVVAVNRSAEVSFSSDVYYTGYIVDWGDEERSFNSSDSMPTQWARKHRYAQNGQYVVTLLLLRGDKVFKAISKQIHVRGGGEHEREAP